MNVSPKRVWRWGKIQYAQWMLSRHPRRYCWADLVVWALGYIEHVDISRSRQCGWCMACMSETEIKREFPERTV